MSRILLSVAAFAALCAVPARAADVAQLACPINELNAAQAAAVGEAAIRRSPPGPWRESLLQAIFACGSRFSWREDQEQTVYVHSLSVLSELAMRDALGDSGIDFVALRRIVESDIVFQDAFPTSNDETQPLNAFLDRHRTAIELATNRALSDSAVTRGLSDYLSAVAMGFWARRQFVAN
jgi:hypothetical protein